MRLWLVIAALSGSSCRSTSSTSASATPPPAWLALCDHARVLCAAAVPGHLSPALAELCHTVDANCTTPGPSRPAADKAKGRINARRDAAAAAASRVTSRGAHATKAIAMASAHTASTTSPSAKAAAQVLALARAQSQARAGHRSLTKHAHHGSHGTYQKPSRDSGTRPASRQAAAMLPHYAMPCHAIPRHATPCHATPPHTTMSRHVAPHHPEPVARRFSPHFQTHDTNSPSKDRSFPTRASRWSHAHTRSKRTQRFNGMPILSRACGAGGRSTGSLPTTSCSLICRHHRRRAMRLEGSNQDQGPDQDRQTSQCRRCRTQYHTPASSALPPGASHRRPR